MKYTTVEHTTSGTVSVAIHRSQAAAIEYAVVLATENDVATEAETREQLQSALRFEVGEWSVEVVAASDFTV